MRVAVTPASYAERVLVGNLGSQEGGQTVTEKKNIKRKECYACVDTYHIAATFYT